MNIYRELLKVIADRVEQILSFLPRPGSRTTNNENRLPISVLERISVLTSLAIDGYLSDFDIEKDKDLVAKYSFSPSLNNDKSAVAIAGCLLGLTHHEISYKLLSTENLRDYPKKIRSYMDLATRVISMEDEFYTPQRSISPIRMYVPIGFDILDLVLWAFHTDQFGKGLVKFIYRLKKDGSIVPAALYQNMLIFSSHTKDIDTKNFEGAEIELADIVSTLFDFINVNSFDKQNLVFTTYRYSPEIEMVKSYEYRISMRILYDIMGSISSYLRNPELKEASVWPTSSIVFDKSNLPKNRDALIEYFQRKFGWRPVH